MRAHADLLLNLVIKEVLEGPEFGFAVKRADEDADPGMINDRVIQDILNSELAVADLSFLRPNAFYELGLRHAAERPVVHVARDGTELPFDNAGQRTVFVDLGKWESIVACRTAVAAAVRQITSPGFELSNLMTQANASFRMRNSSDDRDEVILNLMDQIDALSRRIGQLEQRSDDTDWITFERLIRDKDPKLGFLSPIARSVIDILGRHNTRRGTEKWPSLDLLASADDFSKGPD
jgi:hypothetical protein